MRPVTSHNKSSDLKNLDDFLTKEQKSALASKNSVQMKEADDRALAEAILASLESEDNDATKKLNLTRTDSPTNTASSSKTTATGNTVDVKSDEVTKNIPPPPAAPPRRQIPQQEFDANNRLLEPMRNWLDHSGFGVIANTGKNCDCLLISLLQHATNNYTTENSPKVKALRDELVAQSAVFKINPADLKHSLHGNGEVTNWLVNRVNEKYAIPNHQIKVWMANADLDGNPAFVKLGNGQRNVMIFDMGGHFEAAVPRGTGKS